MCRKNVSRCPAITELPAVPGSTEPTMWPGPNNKEWASTPSNTTSSSLIRGMDILVRFWRVANSEFHCFSRERCFQYIHEYVPATPVQSTAPAKISRYATIWRGLGSSLDLVQASHDRQDPIFKINLVRS